MVLYTCEMGDAFGWPPGPLAHPCARAMNALRDGGHAFEHRTVKGGKGKLWTLPARARDRAEVERLSGQRDVPILVLDDGGIVTGSGAIVTWAKRV